MKTHLTCEPSSTHAAQGAEKPVLMTNSATHTRKTQQKPLFRNRDKSLITAETVASDHWPVAGQVAR